jgi:hypothetical protein
MRIRNTGLKQGKIRHGYKHGATRTFFLVWYWYTPVLAISSPVALTSSFSTGMSPVWWPTFTHTKLSFKTDPSCWVKISNMVPVLYSMYYSVASLLSDKRKKKFTTPLQAKEVLCCTAPTCYQRTLYQLYRIYKCIAMINDTVLEYQRKFKLRFRKSYGSFTSTTCLSNCTIISIIKLSIWFLCQWHIVSSITVSACTSNNMTSLN